MRTLETLGVAACLGGPVPACADGANLLQQTWQHSKTVQQQMLKLHWKILTNDYNGTKEQQLANLNTDISRFSEYWVKQKQAFLVIGADHSCALGTWAGVLNALAPGKQLGLIWLDAHLDAHTFETTPSGNIHGMPLSALLGKADSKLRHLLPTLKAINAQNLILIGTRSYESAEYELLKQAGATIIFARDIADFPQQLTQAVQRLSNSCDTIGLSVDLDFVRPEDAPGVETPVPGGISAQALLAGLAQIRQQPKICGLEISEFNPEKDVNQRTLHLMQQIIETFYG
jgi:arginase